MRVLFARQATFDEIFSDGDFIALAGRFQASPSIQAFLPSVVKNFWGGLRTPDSLTRYAEYWGKTHRSDPESEDEVAYAAVTLTRLYTTWQAQLSRLRGALVEGLVLEQLRERYQQNALVDNATITVTNGIKFTSCTSVDVSGWDGNRGECHDCKVRSKNVDLVLVRDLEAGLPQPEFKVAVVTVDSAVYMAQTLRERGYSPSDATTLISLEDLVALAPLQRPRR